MAGDLFHTHLLSAQKEGFTIKDFLKRVPFDWEPTLLNVLPGLLFWDTFGAVAPMLDPVQLPEVLVVSLLLPF